MVRSELIEMLVADKPDWAALDVDAIVTIFFDEISNRLAAGGRVELRGFGVFSTRARDAGVGRNPHTGEPVDVDAKRVPYFRAGKGMRVRLNVG